MLRDIIDASIGHDIDMWVDMMGTNPIFLGQKCLEGKIQKTHINHYVVCHGWNHQNNLQ